MQGVAQALVVAALGVIVPLACPPGRLLPLGTLIPVLRFLDRGSNDSRAGADGRGGGMAEGLGLDGRAPSNCSRMEIRVDADHSNLRDGERQARHLGCCPQTRPRRARNPMTGDGCGDQAGEHRGVEPGSSRRGEEL